MNTEAKGFLVYKDVKAVVDELTDEQAGMLFRGMLDYFSDGTEPKFDGILKFVFIPIKQQIDRDSERYEQKCEKNRANAKKRWKPSAEKGVSDDSDGMRTYANGYDRMRSDAMDANINTKTKTNTNINTKTNNNIKTTTKTNTKTNTNTNASDVVVVVDGDDDFYDLRKRLSADDVDSIYDIYPETGGDLIDEVSASVKKKRTRVDHPVAYILGFAENVGWMGG